MKALWFHLMPYPALDERFDREARSAWVDLDPGFLDGEVIHRAYHTYLDQLEHAVTGSKSLQDRRSFVAALQVSCCSLFPITRSLVR